MSNFPVAAKITRRFFSCWRSGWHKRWEAVAWCAGRGRCLPESRRHVACHMYTRRNSHSKIPFHLISKRSKFSADAVCTERLLIPPFRFMFCLIVYTLNFKVAAFKRKRFFSQQSVYNKNESLFWGMPYLILGVKPNRGQYVFWYFFQDRPIFNHIIQKVSMRAFHWCGWT